MSIRDYASQQKQMFGYQARDRLPEGHICFLIDEIVDELDLGPAARGNDVLGAPSYDPRMMVKVLFYGYSRGVRSSRKLAAECRENIGFVKLCQGEAPDFRTIALFRQENGPLLERAFSSLVRRLVEAGVVDVSYVIIDGTKVHANASNGKIIHSKFFEAVKEAVDEWMSASASLDKEEEVREKLSSAGVSTGSLGLEGLQRLVNRCSEAVQEAEGSDAKKASLTDPESRFMRDGIGGRINLSYNVQAAVDAESGMLVACDVTQDAHDSSSLVRMADRAEQTSGATVAAIDADSGFFRSDQVQTLEARGKDVCVMDMTAKAAMNRGELEQLIGGEEFVYDAERDVFECPEGNEHVFTRLADKGDGELRRVYMSKRRCDGCPRHEHCFGRSQLRRHTIRRHVDFPWLWKHRARMLQPEYQQRLEKRRRIERVFGHIKHNLGFRRFLLRSLSGAKIETFLVCAASLLRRLCNILKGERRSWGTLLRTPAVVRPRPV